MPKHPTIKVDAEHTARLAHGETVVLKVPPGAETLGIRLTKLPPGTPLDGMAKLCDVFFNGRKA
jgi:hypothetical protein